MAVVARYARLAIVVIGIAIIAQSSAVIELYGRARAFHIHLETKPKLLSTAMIAAAMLAHPARFARAT